jgi:hypothetical protein
MLLGLLFERVQKVLSPVFNDEKDSADRIGSWGQFSDQFPQLVAKFIIIKRE